MNYFNFFGSRSEPEQNIKNIQTSAKKAENATKNQFQTNIQNYFPYNAKKEYEYQQENQYNLYVKNKTPKYSTQKRYYEHRREYARPKFTRPREAEIEKPNTRQIVKEHIETVGALVRCIKNSDSAKGRKLMKKVLQHHGFTAQQLSEPVFGTTALIEAVKVKNIFAFFHLLKKRVHVSRFTDHKGNTALHHACRVGSTPKVYWLLMSGSYWNTEFNNDGNTPLHLACKFGHAKILRQLLDYDAVGLNDKNKFGYTPLMLAAEGNHEEVVQILIRKGAKMNAKNKFGKTALHRAAKYGSQSAIALLLYYGADSLPLDAKSRNFLMDAKYGELMEWILPQLTKNDCKNLLKHMKQSFLAVQNFKNLGEEREMKKYVR